MNFATILGFIRSVADYLVLPGVYVLFSLHGRLSKIEGMLQIALEKVKTYEKKD